MAEVTRDRNMEVRIVRKTEIPAHEQALLRSIPAVAINDEVVSEGRVITKEELEEEIKRRLS
ncbi:MAG: thioredoxin family protein [Nitrospirales bacterium]|nr:thioredoxin family protein [Nitrospirales bacterium]